jgi:hypothetical protein
MPASLVDLLGDAHSPVGMKVVDGQGAPWIPVKKFLTAEVRHRFQESVVT